MLSCILITAAVTAVNTVAITASVTSGISSFLLTGRLCFPHNLSIVHINKQYTFVKAKTKL